MKTFMKRISTLWTDDLLLLVAIVASLFAVLMK